jgi:hypothetical protein
MPQKELEGACIKSCNCQTGAAARASDLFMSAIHTAFENETYRRAIETDSGETSVNKVDLALLARTEAFRYTKNPDGLHIR